jgi:hypothetical protein
MKCVFNNLVKRHLLAELEMGRVRFFCTLTLPYEDFFHPNPTLPYASRTLTLSYPMTRFISPTLTLPYPTPVVP